MNGLVKITTHCDAQNAKLHIGIKSSDMRKAFKYRLLGNRSTFSKADNWLDLCRRLYNTALEQRITIYHQNKRSISCYSQMEQLPELKVAFPEYGEVSAQVLQEVLERLDRAYKAFFRRIDKGNGKVGFPRFRGRDRYNSFTLKTHCWKLDDKYLSISKIGQFKLRLSRPIEGDIKTITIRRVATDKWYVCFSCDNVPEKRLPESNKIIGLDIGIKSFLVDSEGNKVENPAYFRQTEGLLRRRQRIFCRRAKGSCRRHKTRILVAKAHEKVANQRNDFLHKTANYYVANYGMIVTEDLAIQNMVRNHCLARSISDAGWGIFYGFLDYKAEYAGRKRIRAPRFEPSSKTCSACGAINHELKLSNRQWVCTDCGVLHDRDYNAAKNICRVGQTLQALTKEVTLCVA